MRWALALLIGLALLSCSAADAPHPGTITYKHNGVVEQVKNVRDVPDGMRFYDEASANDGSKSLRRVPIVEVDARNMGTGRMEILEYGPGHALLRTTVGFTSPPIR